MLYDERWGKKAENKSAVHQWQVILSLAADKLETVGWIQGKFEKRYRGKCIGYCSLGAIRKVGKNAMARREAETYLGRALDYMPIVSWNDHPARTKEEVIAKLREVANAGN